MSRQVSESSPRPSVFFAVAISPNKLGGVESFTIELARQLDKKGWDLTLCFQAPPPPPRSRSCSWPQETSRSR